MEKKTFNYLLIFSTITIALAFLYFQSIHDKTNTISLVNKLVAAALSLFTGLIQGNIVVKDSNNVKMRLVEKEPKTVVLGMGAVFISSLVYDQIV